MSKMAKFMRDQLAKKKVKLERKNNPKYDEMMGIMDKTIPWYHGSYSDEKNMYDRSLLRQRLSEVSRGDNAMILLGNHNDRNAMMDRLDRSFPVGGMGHFNDHHYALNPVAIGDVSKTHPVTADLGRDITVAHRNPVDYSAEEVLAKIRSSCMEPGLGDTRVTIDMNAPIMEGYLDGLRMLDGGLQVLSGKPSMIVSVDPATGPSIAFSRMELPRS